MNIIEEIIEQQEQDVYSGEMPIYNKQALRKHLLYLESKAYPSNWAWAALEKWGYPADRAECDFDWTNN